MQEVMRAKVPPTFYYDHVSRDLPGGQIIKATKSYVEVELTTDEKAELLSDARHYADKWNGYAADYPGLVASAKATIRALERQ